MTGAIAVPATALSNGLRVLERTVRNRPEGDRNNILFWATMRALEEGNDPREVIVALGSAAIASGLEPRETQATLKSAYNKAVRQSTPEAPPGKPDEAFLAYAHEISQAYWDANGIVGMNPERTTFTFGSAEAARKWESGEIVTLDTIHEWYERDHESEHEEAEPVRPVPPAAADRYRFTPLPDFLAEQEEAEEWLVNNVIPATALFQFLGQARVIQEHGTAIPPHRRSLRKPVARP